MVVAPTATFAPAIGPTIGGYLTETYGWQYIFFVNLVPGALMVVVLWRYRKKSLMPGTPAERLLWAVWVGYVVCCMVIATEVWQLFGKESLYDGKTYPLVRLDISSASHPWSSRCRRISTSICSSRSTQPFATFLDMIPSASSGRTSHQ